LQQVSSNDLVSKEIFDQEIDRLFPANWNFLAHETEIPNPGDFVVRYIAADSIIVVRGEDHAVRAFYNVCRHRGMQVCRADLGTTKIFTCPYHGWTYSNEGRLMGLPLEKPYFGTDGLDHGEYSLRALERVDTYHGLIFGSSNAALPGLEAFLGDLGWYLAIHLQRDPQGLEVVGEPQRWIINCNWKTGAENFSGDTYHAGYTHRSVMEIGIHPNQGSDFRIGGNRNGVNVNAGPGTMSFLRQTPAARGYRDEAMVSMFRNSLPPAQRDLIFGEEPFWPTRTHLFPNFSMLNVAAFIDEDELTPFLNIRIWRPVGPDAVEIWSWILVERSATPEFKAATMRAYVLTFGPTGTEEADDAENFVSTEHVLQGRESRQIPQVLIMNGDLDPESLAKDWPGPGKAIGSTYTDAGNRHFWERWHQAMATEGQPG
jgi:phenylpropionate dioxygenase-like ring-hydroxylating dioxygenase large terminal subunit